ncbi:putative methionyl-tRNA synthetase [Schistosoma mansoni]|uniref:Putative methionyl-tRNA synthetase n=1 Tax=Schistosoma mansoni TaxID=6183 RepID=G4V705_SCHMA|nr:putative methionyl-tRNA synthetase [Schistosoma mansoni]|eukprot:XP_018647733.1 putative methionyl-tRNA synthetase [Schistosoma mansoni]
MNKLLQSISDKLKHLESIATPDAVNYVEACLKVQNQQLLHRIKSLKESVIQQELLLGLNQQYHLPSVKAVSSVSNLNGNSLEIGPLSEKKLVPEEQPEQRTEVQTDSVKTKNPKTERKIPDGKPQSAEKPVDIGRLDLRVGRIIDVNRHPDADSLYVEKVDLGGSEIRTVVSGLVKYLPIESLQNRVGIFLCNLKPAKMRGVESEAMLMCASSPDTCGVEPLIVEGPDIQLGDSVVVPGTRHDPDDQLNPKKKIFEQVKPDLRVNENGIAMYKNVPWTLKGSSLAVIKSLKVKDAQIA